MTLSNIMIELSCENGERLKPARISCFIASIICFNLYFLSKISIFLLRIVMQAEY